jgi:hypothetical protein
MIPFAEAAASILKEMLGDAMRAIDGIPEDDLNEWRPAAGLEDINTFYALMTHMLGAGEYWILHAAAGQPTERNRPAEFRATGTKMELVERAERWLSDTRSYLDSITEADLGRRFVRGGENPLDWSVAECILHAVEHTANHVGHLQIQRQLWDAERR